MDFIEAILYMILRGAAIGVIISAPMGPVGILCVQRTLEKGRRAGLHTGIGAAVSDLVYCLITGFGLSFIEEFLRANQTVIQIVGSVVLLVFGFYLFKSNPSRTLRKPGEKEAGSKRDILSGFLFTFSNPLIIFLIIGLFARFDFLMPELTWVHYIIGFVSILTGALLWWWVVTFFVNKVRNHFNLRSMWLINKIMGSIIMIFAVVGIVTALTTGQARASGREPVYLNSIRGFGSANEGMGSGNTLTLANTASDTLGWFLPLEKAGEFFLSFRAMSPKESPWIVAAKSSGHIYGLHVMPVKGEDNLYPASLHVELLGTDGTAVDALHVSPPGMWNSFEFKCKGGMLSFAGGDRKYNPISEYAVPYACHDSVGFLIPPASSLVLDFITLGSEGPEADRDYRYSHFSSPDVRNTHFSRSADPHEGVWCEFDRQFDASRLEPGGTYTLALVADGDSYLIVYLDGARRNGGAWQPGRTKGYLRPTPFGGIYDLEWISASGQTLPGEAKAQFGNDGLLRLHFVDHDSVIRFAKIK